MFQIVLRHNNESVFQIDVMKGLVDTAEAPVKMLEAQIKQKGGSVHCTALLGLVGKPYNLC